MAARVLLVEDEEDLAQLLRMGLEMAGYEVTHAGNVRDAKRAVLAGRQDVMVLDRMLPDGNGVELCRWVRGRNDRTPILMLTAMGEEHDILTGLESGADDYVCKPFQPRVLLARIAALLRRNGPQDDGEKCVQVGRLTLDRARALVSVGERRLTLTVLEFNLLEALLKARGQVLSREQLLQKMHQDTAFVSARTVDVHMVSLRRKLGEDNCIETVRGLGYRVL